MKKIVGVIIAVATLVLCLALSACGNRYKSHYNSKLMVEEKTSNTASISFDSFSGTYVMKFDEKVSGEVSITYQATLAEGNIKVYYDFNEEKLDLFEIGSNGNANGKTEAFTGSQTIYVII
ncbi:MAG: hypothetical protein K2N84_06405 [Clostridia bacterium]|nr:hypothetical protein [Clostridia bacterium]